MKKFFIILLMTFSMLYAEETVLIDFTKLKAEASGENLLTTLDLSSYLKDAKTSYSFKNWEIELNNSINTVYTTSNSFVKEVVSKESGTVLGVRVNFGNFDAPSHATIRPPFSPLSVNDQNVKFDGLGFVRNVGELKSVSATIYGRNNDHSLYILLDNGGNEVEMLLLGSLKFDGWKTMTWNSSTYISDVKDRQLSVSPIYPLGGSYIKFLGFVLRRDADSNKGDSIFYAKNVSITYDKAIIEKELDIDDESTWSIVSNREKELSRQEMQKIANKLILKIKEQERMHK